MKSIFLYGAPASGKSTLGKRLAGALKTAFVDLDAVIVEKAGMEIPAIFSAEGEAGFRVRESAALREVVDGIAGARTVGADSAGAETVGAVIALGGGTLLDAANRELCESAGAVLCLETPSDEELKRRIAAGGDVRPLGDKARERAAHYASFPRRISASFEAGESLVVVGSGIAMPIIAGRAKVVDGNVAELYPELGDGRIAVIPSGEENKTPQTVMNIWHAFGAAGLGRHDVVTAVGGGVTGDLTGFAAATWMRGIDWINVPTSLLAMVDASTGGKTGCDLPEGKNLAGAFHSPRLVVIDTEFLKTLPAKRIADGRAEMIKHEVIGGGEKVKVRGEGEQWWIDPGEKDVPGAGEIAENLRVKVEIVKEDPLEKLGRRILLNCGHTVAHAVEKITDYRVSHGEAVAIGCVAEAKLAVQRGLAPAEWPRELAEKFAAAGLPVELPGGVTLDALRPLMVGDKKRRGNVVTFALPCGWGDVRAVEIDLSDEEVL